jgi:hypothetical protein
MDDDHFTVAGSCPVLCCIFAAQWHMKLDFYHGKTGKNWLKYGKTGNAIADCAGICGCAGVRSIRRPAAYGASCSRNGLTLVARQSCRISITGLRGSGARRIHGCCPKLTGRPSCTSDVIAYLICRHRRRRRRFVSIVCFNSIVL